MICDWRKRAGETGSVVVSMRLLCGSASCQFNGPSKGLSRTKSKFQRFESDSVWRWSSSAACCRASPGDDGPNRHRFTRDKQPALGTIRGRPPPPKREYDGKDILTSSKTGAARTRVLMMIRSFKKSKLMKMASSNNTHHTTKFVVFWLEKKRDYHTIFFKSNERLCLSGKTEEMFHQQPGCANTLDGGLASSENFRVHTRRYYDSTTHLLRRPPGG